MPHEIESNFVEDYWNEEKQCRHCDSSKVKDEINVCDDSKEAVPLNGHCDFFRSID